MRIAHAASFVVVLGAAAPAVAQGPTSHQAAVFQLDAAEFPHLLHEGVRLARFAEPFAEQDRERERQEREAEQKRRARERESELFENGSDAVSEQRWDRAINHFRRLVDMKGSRADGALYWIAYSQNRLGQRADALATIGELTKAHPGSRYVKQAQVLEVEIRGAAGQPVRPESQSDEELKLMAITHLQNADPEQTVPLLEKLLNGTASPQLKDRALFVLAQINSPRAREVLKNLAKGSSTPELQSRAIRYLGVHGGRESRAVLAEVYGSSTDADVKRSILRAFMVAGEKDRIFQAAQSETNPEVRAEAVRQLGVMSAHEELWQLYQKETSVDVRKRILEAMFVGGNVTRMIDLAKAEQTPELRRSAVRHLGLMGSKASADALLEIYATDKDPAIRKAVINALHLQGNAAALVALARKEQDIQLKKDIVQKLSIMQDKIATDYMLELLNK